MKICETHSMNRAAAELFITQPALSLAVRRLEDSLGVTLFIRSNKGISLTEEGEALLRHCMLLMKQMELIDNISHERREPVLSVSAFPYIINPAVFLDLINDPSLKGLRIEYEEGRVQRIFDNVSGLSSQLGILQFNNHQRRIIEQKAEDLGLVIDIIAVTPWAVAIGPKSPLYDREEVSFDELRDHRLLRMKDDVFSFVTGELQIGGLVIGDLPHDSIQSCTLTEYLLAHTCSYMLCGMQNPFADASLGLRVVPLAGSEVSINIAAVKRKDHKPGEAEIRFMVLLQKSLDGYNKTL